MNFASQANPNQYIFGAVYAGARVNKNYIIKKKNK